MAQLDAMAVEFEAALDRLEQIASPLAGARAQAVTDAVEIGRLRQQCESLLSRIAELEKQSRVLAGVADEIETRLDDAIAEIRTALAQ